MGFILNNHFTRFHFLFSDFTKFHKNNQKGWVKSLLVRDLCLPLRTDKKDLCMNRHLYALCFLFLLMGCTKPSMKDELDTYERDIEREPKATYELLKVKEPSTSEDRAHHALLLIKAKNLAYIPLEGKDTLDVLNAINYYRKHRDTERIMQGYYLLGSIYRDLGDAPRGVEAFNRVIEFADTTDASCDYRIMARAEAQKSDLQELQKVRPQAIKSSNKAEYYALKARDTSYAIQVAFGTIGLHSMNGNNQPMIKRVQPLIQKCMDEGDTILALYQSIGFAWEFLRIGMEEEANNIIQLYEMYDGTPYPMYFGTKGELYLAQHQLDSAEWCFRKELEATDWNNRQTAYRGLKKVFELRHLTDSALKYATLQCEAVDSDYKHKVSEDIVRMEQVYNYEVEKEKVRQSEVRQQRMKWMAELAGLVAIIVALTAFISFRLLRDRHRRNLLLQKNESERLKTQLAEKEKELAQEESKRREAESRAAQMETNVLEINTELQQLEHEREELHQVLDALKGGGQSDSETSVNQAERILELEEQMRQKDKDIQEVEKEVERKKKELFAQQEMMDRMQSTIEEYREEAQSMENYGEGVQQMRRQLKEKKHATVRAWMALQKQVVKLHPTFVKSMREQVSPLMEGELRVAMLIKMGFQPSEIALLMDRSPQMVSMTRRRLYMKAFGKNPEDLKDVDEWIKGT